MKKLVVFICIFLISACTPYTLVKSEKTDLNGLSVVPSGSWSALSSMLSVENIPTWTADGSLLNSIMFFGPISNEQKLIKGSDQTNYPEFRKDMLPSEVVEIVESTVTQLYGATILENGTLKPFKINNEPGFQFGFKFAGQDEVPRGLLATGIIKNDMLYIVLYQAANLHFYDKDLANVQRMMASISII